MAKKILNIATFGIAGALLGGKKKKAAPAPEPGPVVMPLADDDAIMRAKRKSLIQQRGRAGRSSTMLTSDSDTLGSY